MSQPLPSSPGDQREDHAQAVAAAVAAVYAQAELVLIATVASLARKVAAGAMLAGVAERRLAHAGATLFASVGPRVRTAAGTYLPVIAPSLDAATRTAVTASQEALTAAVSDTSPHLLAVNQALSQARTPGGPMSLDRIRAAQQALDDLGRQGITGFTDRAGRRWNLTSYVEMATRTAVSNAWDERQAAALTRAGLDLVLVGTRSTEGSCPHCLPWLGRTLSLAGLTPGYLMLADAKAAGFRHPNCRCSWAPLGAPAALPTAQDLARSAAIYEASQRQRALERRVRAAHRKRAAAVTPAARAEAHRLLRAAMIASDQHRVRAGLDAATSWFREHPHHAR